MVVDFTQVGEKDVSQPLMVKLFEELPGIRIGEMAAVASDSLLQVGGVGAFHEKLHVVIGFQDQGIAAAELFADQMSDDAKIGTDSHPDVLVTHHEAAWFPGVMRDGERVNGQVPDGKTPTRLEHV